MRRFILGLATAFVMFCGAAFAGEGTVVSFEQGTLTVTVDGKEQKIPLRGVKVLDAEGKEIARMQLRDSFKKDAKVEITEKDGKVTEVKLKK